MRSQCPARVCICCDPAHKRRSEPPHNGTYGKKKVRINPVVERTTLLAPRSRHYISDDYDGCSRRSESIGRRRRCRRDQSPFDSYSDAEASSYPYGSSQYSQRRYGSVKGSRYLLPCPPVSSNHARMRSPQKERPLYDDDDDYIPRPQRVVQRAAKPQKLPVVPVYDNNKQNILFHRKNHYFARGDSLTHKNLTRTYVFHRQPFDWYDSNQGVVLEDIEQILEPEDLYEPEDAIPVAPPPPPQPTTVRSGRVPFEPSTVLYAAPPNPRYEQPPSSRTRPVERKVVVPSGGSGGSNQFYDDLYAGSHLETATGSEITSRPSPPKNADHRLINTDKERPSAFRSPSISSRNGDDSKSSPKQSYFVIEKESSTPNGAKTTTFRSSEFISPSLANEQFNEKFNDSPRERKSRPRNQTMDERRNFKSDGQFDMSDDINRIMRKFDEIGINEKPRK